MMPYVTCLSLFQFSLLIFYDAVPPLWYRLKCVHNTGIKNFKVQKTGFRQIHNLSHLCFYQIFSDLCCIHMLPILMLRVYKVKIHVTIQVW